MKSLRMSFTDYSSRDEKSSSVTAEVNSDDVDLASIIGDFQEHGFPFLGTERRQNNGMNGR
jgi:hypothetical protein